MENWDLILLHSVAAIWVIGIIVVGLMTWQEERERQRERKINGKPDNTYEPKVGHKLSQHNEHWPYN